MNNLTLAFLIVLIAGGIGVAAYIIYEIVEDPNGPTSIIGNAINLAKDVGGALKEGDEKLKQTEKATASLIVSDSKLVYNQAKSGIQKEVSVGVNAVKDVKNDLTSAAKNTTQAIKKAPEQIVTHISKQGSDFINSITSKSHEDAKKLDHGVSKAGEEVKHIAQDAGHVVRDIGKKTEDAVKKDTKKAFHKLTSWL
jgi:hypothetical protein